MEKILSKIRSAVQKFEELPLDDTKEQSEILRSLTCNLFFLEAHRVKAHEQWTDACNASTEKSAAAKERQADLEVPELYLCRRVLESGYKVCDAIRSTISIHKKER